MAAQATFCPRRRRRRPSTVARAMPLLFSLIILLDTINAFVVRPFGAPFTGASPPLASRSAAATTPTSSTVMMVTNNKASSTSRKPRGSFLGRFLLRTLGTLSAAIGLAVAPLPRQTVEDALADPEAALQQLQTMDVGATMRDGAGGLLRNWEDGGYESTLSALSAKAGEFLASVQASLARAGEVDVGAVTELIKSGDMLQALNQATGIDASATNVALQAKGAEWLTAFDGRVEEAAQGLGDLLGGSGAGVLPPGLASQDVVRNVASFLKQAAINPTIRLQTEETLAAILVSGLGLTAAKALFFAKPSAGALMTGPPLVYDPALIDAYFGARPGKVLARLVSGLSASSGFLSGLLMDYVLGTKEENAEKRAIQVKNLITELGPVFIKVAQLISVRPDILGPVYLKQLQLLQDQVKPFSSAEATEIIASNLPKGTQLTDVYKDPAMAFKEPVAAASLGQVYKAELVDGTEVAVKVQRPNMLENITLDLYTVRLLCNIGKRVPKIAASCASFIEVLNNWGGRFQQEIDYVQEKENTRKFAEAMGACELVKDAIVVPEVFDSLSTRDVLVTTWIEGRKINSFNKDDPAENLQLQKILAVMLNSYLVQLLDTGILHADPHAGNFLVTPDGRLAILDHGLVTEIEADRRLALIEYVAHLTAQDWEATVCDLVRLGFIPQEIADDKKKLGIVAPILGSVLEQLSNGGGAKAVNVDEIGDQVESLAEQYPLTIPPWFGLIVRAFSAIEGLGLGLDPSYSIVNQCFPFLARRLLTDDSPRVRAALKSFLYGSEQQLKVERVNDMIEGYRNFTNSFDEMAVTVGGAPLTSISASSFSSPSSSSSLAPLPNTREGLLTLASSAARREGGGKGYLEFDKPTMEVLQILFNKDGNFVQELVTDELVRMADAAIKEVTGLVARRAKSTPLAISNFIRRPTAGGPLGTLALLPFFPLMTLLGILTALAERAETLSQLTEEDRESLKTLRLLLGVVAVRPTLDDSNSSSSNNSPFPFPFPPLPPFFFPRPGRSSSSGTFPFPFPLPPPFGSPANSAAFVENALGVSRQVLPEIAPGVAAIGRRFLSQLTGRILNRLADELDGPGNRL
ncbi:Hypothetical protein NocV09_00600680 [Nannochloropsis oceanica]